MQKFFKSRLMRSIVPYFVLGVLLILAFRIISEIGFFTDHLARFWSVVTPFFIGGVLAFILNLPCSAIQRLYKGMNNKFVQRRSRALSVLSLFIIIVVLLVFAYNLVIPAITESANTFVYEIDTHLETLRGWMVTVDAWNLPDFFPGTEEDIVTMFEGIFAGFELDGMASSVLAGFGAAGAAVFSAVFSMILIIISSIYFLIEKDRLKIFVKRLVSAISSIKTNNTILKYSRKLNHNFHMYIYTQTIDGIILGSLMTAFLFIIQSPYALLLGLILGVLNYIPYFGSIFGTAFAVIVVAFTQGIPTAAGAAVIMFIIQQIDSNYIQPKLMGGSFSLSPLLVIISVTIGMAYGGILGMLVAIPIVAILKDILDEYIEHREELRRNPPPPTDDNFMDREIL